MKNIIFSLFLISLITLVITSCNHYDSIQSSGKESKANGRSHNAGQNCISCHNDNSNEASSSGRWWYFAGTAYNKSGTIASNGGKVELWSNISAKAIATGHLDSLSLATGTKIYSVEVDREGNFYTSKIFDMRKGFYPRMVAANNTDTIMTTITANGACNSCHGHNADNQNQLHVIFNN